MSERALSNKIAVVTGAGKGIGRAIAERLAADGADCFLLARSDAALAEVAGAIEGKGRAAGWAAIDLATLAGCEAAAKAALDRFGRIDILVNCAGATRAGAFPEQPDADWMAGFDLKFHGAVRLTRLFWPALKEARGTVVNIGGGAAYTPGPGFMVGGAVNAALAHFSKALATQGIKDDVNVNIVHPGMTVTDRMQKMIEQRAAASGTTVEEERARTLASSGMRRLGQADDVANVVAFLCDPAARHIQGVQIAVDGGATTGLH
ncbi:SDR family NAD(P)-dependent oxidoreductase [Oceanibacterium hippocampi]|uniref:3-oxoacyl-[acyl-carrier-protein] reductase FabG n=1 Tax=Oceanibacterium hippocampi TaxID=745714 RepID=A0A1Y5S2D2_9PROT|nr:SDR family NAD(P)-dependent oxidoreductase [Oceanibacterium hippocampi]SLN30725.1 3-oxoacyl-[acyl-carrier-protein] reductase FabG [Oceanibacterium hippocampi]